MHKYNKNINVDCEEPLRTLSLEMNQAGDVAIGCKVLDIIRLTFDPIAARCAEWPTTLYFSFAMQSISTNESPGIPPCAAIVVRTGGTFPKRPRKTSFIAL
jgi:hypothetical protein